MKSRIAETVKDPSHIKRGKEKRLQCIKINRHIMTKLNKHLTGRGGGEEGEMSNSQVVLV